MKRLIPGRVAAYRGILLGSLWGWLMALTTCPDCEKPVSTSAPNCPNCGRPMTAETSAVPVEIAAQSRAPIFLIICAVCFFIMLGTPRILAAVPVGATVICGVVAFFRREKARWIAVILAVLALILWFVNMMEMQRAFSDIGSTSSSPFAATDLTKAEVADWNWSKDPDFGTRGTIKWNVTVKNNSDRHMAMVGVQFTSFDKDGKLVSTRTTYVSAIPSGQSRSEDSYADLYGTEVKANVVIESIRYAD